MPTFLHLSRFKKQKKVLTKYINNTNIIVVVYENKNKNKGRLILMKTRFCSNCGYELSDGNQCKQQENQDGRVIHKCKNCGKQVEYKPTENNVYECMVEENQWHRINLGRLGYGSCMD
jgi:RNase P subunit RPR2